HGPILLTSRHDMKVRLYTFHLSINTFRVHQGDTLSPEVHASRSVRENCSFRAGLRPGLLQRPQPLPTNVAADVPLAPVRSDTASAVEAVDLALAAHASSLPGDRSCSSAEGESC